MPGTVDVQWIKERERREKKIEARKQRQLRTLHRTMDRRSDKIRQEFEEAMLASQREFLSHVEEWPKPWPAVK